VNEQHTGDSTCDLTDYPLIFAAADLVTTQNSSIRNTDSVPPCQNDQGNPVASGEIGIRVDIRIRRTLVLQLTLILRQVVSELVSCLNKTTLGHTIFQDKVVWSTSVTVNDHQQQGLEPDEVDSSRLDHQWLAGVEEKEILGIVEAIDFLEMTGHASQIGASCAI
jgi:hypothetical protein